MVKWVLIALAVFVLYKLFVNDKGRRVKDEAKIKEKKIATGEMKKDPICGSYVDVEGSITVRDGDTTHHFCSYDCRKKFLEKLQDAGREIPQIETKDDD